MKRGTTPTLQVVIDINNTDIASIDFLFKQEKSESAVATLTKNYPAVVEYDDDNKIYNVPFTEADTRLFQENRRFWMDLKITTVSGTIPATPIMELYMDQTLFAAAGGVQDG